MAYTQAHLDALEAALVKGEKRVTFGDKTVEYRSVDELQAAIAALVEAKPHLKARSFAPGGAAQGAKNATSGGVDLLGMLRANA